MDYQLHRKSFLLQLLFKYYSCNRNILCSKCIKGCEKYFDRYSFVDLNHNKSLISQEPSWPPCPPPSSQRSNSSSTTWWANTGWIFTVAVFAWETKSASDHTVIKNDLAVHIGTEYIYVIQGVWWDDTDVERRRTLFILGVFSLCKFGPGCMYNAQRHCQRKLQFVSHLTLAFQNNHIEEQKRETVT